MLYNTGCKLCIILRGCIGTVHDYINGDLGIIRRAYPMKDTNILTVFTGNSLCGTGLAADASNPGLAVLPVLRSPPSSINGSTAVLSDLRRSALEMVCRNTLGSMFSTVAPLALVMLIHHEGLHNSNRR